MVANAKLTGWGARVLYLGPALGLTPHRNATAVLAVALDGKLEVADDPVNPNEAYRSVRSVLVPPNTLHHLRIASGSMAFLYVDPLSRDLDALRARMLELTPRAGFGLINETAVIEVLTGLVEGRIAVRDGRQVLGELLGVGVRADADVRIVAALRQMRDEPHRSHSLTELGECAGLSASRFLHLFKPRPACRCGATGYGIAWARRSGRSMTECP
jgi:hypothetical protein